MALESSLLSHHASSLDISMIRRRFLATALAGLPVAAGLPLPGPARAAPLPMTLPKPPRDARTPILVVNGAAQHTAIPNFRSFEDIAAAAKARGIDDRGLQYLAVSGSAQFTASAWRRLRNESRLTGTFTVVDLRQESHGFLDSHAVTWLAADNWANVGMTREQAMAIEVRRLHDLSRLHQVTPPTIDDYRHRGIRKGPELPVHHVAGEAALISQSDARYVRLTVTDHLRPTDADVDRVVLMAMNRLSHQMLHFHCLDGAGRTTTFMAMMDMLANAYQVSFEAILARQAALPPYTDLTDLQIKDGKDGPYTPYYRERLAFLRSFHAFAAARRHGERRRWTRWAADGGA